MLFGVFFRDLLRIRNRLNSMALASPVQIFGNNILRPYPNDYDGPFIMPRVRAVRFLFRTRNPKP